MQEKTKRMELTPLLFLSSGLSGRGSSGEHLQRHYFRSILTLRECCQSSSADSLVLRTTLKNTARRRVGTSILATP